MQELLEQFTPAIESFTLIPSGGGRFEVKANDRLLYSKKETGRHAEEGELKRIFEEDLELQPQPLD